MRTLPHQFEARHGFQPLLAESFHDPEEHTGTLYKATNRMPGYGALNDIVSRIDPVALARALNAWLVANSELLPKSLAMDGKSLDAKGRRSSIVSLCFHAIGQWKEDATRPRQKASGGRVLALRRGALLLLHDKEAFPTLNASFHHHSARRYAGLRLLKTTPPKVNKPDNHPGWRLQTSSKGSNVAAQFFFCKSG